MLRRYRIKHFYVYYIILLCIPIMDEEIAIIVSVCQMVKNLSVFTSDLFTSLTTSSGLSSGKFSMLLVVK